MIKRKVMEYSIITLGVFLLHIGFYFFLQPIAMVIGGMMGISVLIEPLIPFLSLGSIYLSLNIIALIIGGIFFGKQFLLRTVYATLLAPLLVFIFELVKVPTDLILSQIETYYVTIIGTLGSGVFVGTGIGLVLRYNSSTGGMDVYQKLVNKYLKVPFSIAVYVTDGIIILFGMFLNFQNGLFAVISMLITGLLIEKVAIAGRSSYTALIITKKTDQIKELIFEKLDRGMTKVRVVGGYTDHEKDMIICSIYRQQVYDLKQIILSVDPGAFTLILQTKEVLGEGFHRNELT